jgi:hypothetical protein
MVFGILVMLSPVRAAKIWASGRLDGMTSEQRVSFLRWYRAFGVVLFLGGFLFAVDSIWFPNYPP